VGEMATEDTDVEVDRLEAMGRGIAHHSSGFTAAHVEWGGAPVRGSFGGCGGQLGVRGGAWRWWETHRCRGGLERWLDEEAIDEVVVEEVVGGAGFRALRRLHAERWLGVGAALDDPTRSCKATSRGRRL
jgi:hypothetical protein